MPRTVINVPIRLIADNGSVGLVVHLADNGRLTLHDPNGPRTGDPFSDRHAALIRLRAAIDAELNDAE